MVEGVTDGFERGSRSRASATARAEGQGPGAGARLLASGRLPAPDGIEFEVPQPTEVIVRGIDKQLVGEIAAHIRKSRPPEPYKGKGIRYAGRAGHPQGR